jgi:hypothetical protein
MVFVERVFPTNNKSVFTRSEAIPDEGVQFCEVYGEDTELNQLPGAVAPVHVYVAAEAGAAKKRVPRNTIVRWVLTTRLLSSVNFMVDFVLKEKENLYERDRDGW